MFSSVLDGYRRIKNRIPMPAVVLGCVALLGLAVGRGYSQIQPGVNSVGTNPQAQSGTALNPTYGIHDAAGLARNPPDPNVPCIVPAAWRGDVRWMHDVAPHNKIDDKIDVSNNPADRFNIIVNFNQVLTDTNGIMHANYQTLLNGVGTVQFVGTVIPTVSLANVTLANIQMIAGRSDVAFIEKQRPHVWHLDKACQATKVRGPFYADTVQTKFPAIFGDGINVVVMDSGCDDPGGPGTTNVDLPASVHAYDASPGTFTNPDDENEHGTHVAGIALGRSTSTGTPPTIIVPLGVAAGPKGTDNNPAHGANLIDVKVANANGGVDGNAVLSAIQVLIQRKQSWKIDVINMSFGSSFDDDGNDAESQLVDRATLAGIVVVISAGNAGPLNVGIGPPASASTAITVGSFDDNDTPNRTDDVVSSFSSRGPRKDNHDGDCLNELKPEVSGPGNSSDFGANAGGILSAKWNTANEGHRLAGTSMSSPHVAGICALMLSANPNLTPAQVKAALISTAERRGDPSAPSCSPDWNRDFGWGLVDAYKAVAAVNNLTPPNEPHVCVTQLTLQAPTGNETLVKGTIKPITWTFNGATDDVIDIFLTSGTTYLGAIAKNVPVLDMEYNWTVGSALDTNAAIPQGSNYGVTIRPSFCTTPTSSSFAAFEIIDAVIANAPPPGAVVPVGQTIPIVQVAPGDSVTLGGLDTAGAVTVATKGMPPYTYEWSPSNFLDNPSIARPTATPQRTITYTLTVRDATGVTDSDKVTVVIGNPLAVDAGPNKVFRLGSTVVLEGVATGGAPPYNYDWSPIPDPTLAAGLNGATLAQPTARPTQPSVYTLRVTDSIGTVKTDTVAVLPGLSITVINNPGNAGMVTRSIVKDLYTAGDQILLQATPNAGWTFDKWDSPSAEFDHRPADSSAALTENPTPLTFRTGDVRVQAVFKQITATISAPGTGTNNTSILPTGICGSLAPELMLAMMFGLALMRRGIRRR